MAALSSSLSSPAGPSLLNPPNPSISAVDSTPRGGILLNPRRLSDSPQSRPLSLPQVNTSTGLRRTSTESPRTPVTPIHEAAPSTASITLPIPSSPSLTPSPSDVHSSAGRIRFAPLPDPRRPRSLSTGRNVVWKPTEGPTGETTRSLEIRGVEPKVGFQDDGDDISDEEAIGDGEFGEGEDDEYGEKRGRRWSKTVGSWGKGTKKLFGVKDREDGYSEGAPLKKSVSTGGFIGS